MTDHTESTTDLAPAVTPPEAATDPVPPADKLTDPDAQVEPENRETAADGDLGEAGRKALAAEREAAKTAKADAERFQQERDAAAERVRELEAAEMRRTVADDRRLSPAQAELLVGSTAEEMGEHADRMLAAFRPVSKFDRPREALRTGSGAMIDAGPSTSEIASEVLKG